MIRLLVSLGSAVLTASACLADPAALYQTHCVECHGENRLGLIGPALLPETLGSLRGTALQDTIRSGREATEMPSFRDVLNDQQIDELSAYLKTPLDPAPVWGMEQISASLIKNDDYELVKKPLWSADPLNVTLVVETSDHSVSVLDGDSFEVLTRFKTPFGTRGQPKFSPDGHYVYIMSRDGWIQKFDLYALQEVSRVRAGLNSRNIMLSHDGKWIAVANYLPNTFAILSADDLSPQKVEHVKGKDGSPSRVSAVYLATKRKSFVLALKDAPSIWEVFYGLNPPHYGFAHDWRVEGPAPNKDPFPLRTITVKSLVEDFYLDPTDEYVMGASPTGKGGQVVDLVIGHKIADLDLTGMPHLGSGSTWKMGERTVMATPHLREPLVSIVDMKTWETLTQIEMLGSGFFTRTHENSPYLWVDVFFGPHKDAIQIIDKQTLEIVKTLRPQKGARAAHVEFTQDGKHALVSIWEEDGAVVIYDAKTLEEIDRLPMKKPRGKYNVGNRIEK
ncbi:Nitrite reductase protein (NO-forming) [Pseudovibrio sp. FO-BEG1]|uniref:nitrite reductase n=1 Tax=Pseudovibrio sp. (strain FO-BEG1) TaxID=911045 RepID=UPI000238C3A8|nr:nitrite reductase [Pseudovibrio sp. FO-BEG1]AEV35407.1 Nitrite reductase protein (NO-forming) [Pseudovibrio sp. FO-BEG1]